MNIVIILGIIMFILGMCGLASGVVATMEDLQIEREVNHKRNMRMFPR